MASNYAPFHIHEQRTNETLLMLQYTKLCIYNVCDKVRELYVENDCTL